MSGDMLAQIAIRQHEAEKLFAAAAFTRPEMALQDCGWLDAKLFKDEKVRKFWAGLKETGDPIAAALTIDSFYMGELATNQDIFYGYGVRQYADLVLKEAWLYSIGEKLPKLAKAITEGEVEWVQTLIKGIGSDVPQSAEKLENAYDVGLEFIELLNNTEDYTIFTGTPLDEPTGGLWRSTLSVLCARPSIGKSALAFQLARCVAKTGKKVIYFSFEMSRRALWGRAACGVARVPYRDILARRINDEQRRKLEVITSELMDAYGENLIIDEKPQTTSDIWRKVATINPDLIIVDHIRLCLDKDENEIRRLGAITWQLKQVAKEFNIHSLAVAQLNRSLESRTDKRPTLADLRDSGQIEENADFVFGLHREKQYVDKSQEKSPADLFVMKFRDGPSELHLRLTFDGLGQWFEKRMP